MASSATGIEWTDRTWNPLRGCSRKSDGCRNCYAERVAWRFGSKLGAPYHGLVQMTSQGPKWTGVVREVPEALAEPLHWKEPSMIFVDSMSDLFHENVADAFIDAVVAVMWLSVRHTYQVLTKRPERARKYFTELAADSDFDARMSRACDRIPMRGTLHCDKILKNTTPGWPAPPTMWLGISVEDQPTLEERVHDLLATQSALHFLSVEPMLGPVDPTRIGVGTGFELDALRGVRTTLTNIGGVFMPAESVRGHARVDWVICGGESGPGARPMHPDWARSLRDQCAAAGVPFLFKQWGEWSPDPPEDDCDAVCSGLTPQGELLKNNAAFNARTADAELMFRVGKKHAGRLLYGVEHNAFPEVANAS